MFEITTVVETARRSLPFGGGDTPSRDDGPLQPPSSNPAVPSKVFKELGVRPQEYIVQLCDWNGGRMKQQAVVEHTGWSQSTVSRLLSDIEDDGHIVRASIGREKVVGLPERMPETSEVDLNLAGPAKTSF